VSANTVVELIYDGTRFQIIGGASSSVPGMPVYLMAPQTYYVNASTGSDAYDGLSATVSGVHGPFATIQKAINTVALFNLNGYNITINVANGSYTTFYCLPVSGSGNVNIVGNPSSPASVQIVGLNHSAVYCFSAGSAYTLNGFGVAVSGTNVLDAMAGINCNGTGSSISISNIYFGTCSGTSVFGSSGGPHLCASQGGEILLSGAMFINGGAYYHAYCSEGTIFTEAGSNLALTITASPTFGGAFIISQGLGFAELVYPGGITGASSVTGIRYSVVENSVMNTGGGGASYYPGNSGGSASTGGQYI
jgi:hypothetical protein